MHAKLPGAAFAVVACAASFIACGEFQRNNPFDPDVAVSMSIAGPDTITTQFDTVRFTITSEPDFDHSQTKWEASPLVPVDSNGTYRVPRLAGWFKEFTVTGQLGTRIVKKKVVIRLRPTALSPCGNEGVLLEALRNEDAVCFGFLDRRGTPIDLGDMAQPTPTFSIGNPSVIEAPYGIGGASGTMINILIRSLAVGTTDVTIASNGLTLTVPVTVRQRARYFTMRPGCPSDGIRIRVGQSIQLALGMPIFDANHYPLTDPADIQAAPTNFTWGVFYNRYPERATITSGGLLTGLTAGPLYQPDVLYASTASITSDVASCQLVVE